VRQLHGAGEGDGVGGVYVVLVTRTPTHAEPPGEPPLAASRVEGFRDRGSPAASADPHVLGPPLVAERPGLVEGVPQLAVASGAQKRPVKYDCYTA
jgi:hypothetical protein